VLTNEKEARALAQKQQTKQRELPKPTRAVSLDDFFAKVEGEQTKELNLILKTDVQGSIEPIKNSLEQLETEEVKIKIIHSSSGGITESDVLFALASKGIIIGFNTTPAPSVQRQAELEGVDIRSYKIIYELIEDIERAVKGMKAPQYVEVIEGHAEVRALFSSSKVGQIAGVYISDGKVSRDAQIRIIRRKQIVHQGSISSLKRFKDDVKVVNTGFECGIGIEGFNQFEEGDIIEAYRKEKADESTY
jgi:translation initiation factor IF-2